MLTFATLYLLFGIVFLTDAMWIVGDLTRSHLATRPRRRRLGVRPDG